MQKKTSTNNGSSFDLYPGCRKNKCNSLLGGTVVWSTGWVVKAGFVCWNLGAITKPWELKIEHNVIDWPLREWQYTVKATVHTFLSQHSLSLNKIQYLSFPESLPKGMRPFSESLPMGLSLSTESAEIGSECLRRSKSIFQQPDAWV